MGRKAKYRDEERDEDEEDADDRKLADATSDDDAATREADKKPRKSWFGLGKKSSDNDGPGGNKSKKPSTKEGTKNKIHSSVTKQDPPPAPVRQNSNTQSKKTGSTGRKSILNTVREKPKSRNLPGQLSRWWVLEHLETEALELGDEFLETEGHEIMVSLPLFVLNPTSKRRIVWDSIVTLLLMYNILMIPFRLAFSETQVDWLCAPGPLDHQHFCPGRPWLEAWNQPIWFWFDFSLDCFFLIDIGVNFLTSFEFLDARGEKQFEVRRGIIAFKYFKGWFVVDFVTSVPVEPILYFAGIKNSSTAGLFRVLKIARFLKIARLWRLGRFVSKVKEVLDLNPALVRMAQLLGVFTLLAHWLACGMFWSGTFYQRYRECKQGSNAECIWTEFMLAGGAGAV